MDKFTHTGWGFAKKGTKLLRHYDTKGICHSELLAEESFLKGTRILRHYGTRVNLPLPTGEVDFVSERSEFTKSGEGTIFKMLNRAKKKCAFTLAEVLIVLAVLGVVAAMTIPDLVQDYQKKATATAVKKAYSTLNQVITASAADNGPASDYLSSGQAIDANTTKEFFETYWLPYFRVQKVSNNGAIGFYGTWTPYYNLNGNNNAVGVFTSYTSGRVLFSDVSGIIYLIKAKTESSDSASVYSSTQDIYVDINGIKGPNIFGKDVFLFVADLNDGVVNPYGYNVSKSSIKSACSNSGSGFHCAAKIKQDGWEIADDYPW